MLPTLYFEYFQIITITADFVIFIFVIAYFFHLREKEKELQKKETNIDTSYHQIVDDALNKERVIIDDATHEADSIITGAQYVKKSSKDSVDHTLEQLLTDIKKDADGTAQNITKSYNDALQKLTNDSLADFQKVTKGLEAELVQQFKTFHESMLPNLEKQLAEYKQSRIKQTEQEITHIVQEVSQQVLNKSLSLEDHQQLVLESLERAKKEGVFD